MPWSRLFSIVTCGAVSALGVGAPVRAQVPPLSTIPLAYGQPTGAAAGQRTPAEQLHFGSAGAVGAPSSDERETLDAVWAAAEAADHRLKAREWDVSAAEHRLDRARSDRWPNLFVEGNYTVRDHEQAFLFNDPLAPPGTTFNYQQQEDFAFLSRVEVPIYTSGRISESIGAASAGLDASELELDEYRRLLKLKVAEEYVQVLRAQSDLQVAESRVHSLEAHLKNVELLHAHQRVPRNDLLAAQVELSQAQQEAIHASHVLDASRAALNRRLGRPLPAATPIAELAGETALPQVEELTDRALGQRPEIARLSARIRQTQGQANSRQAAGKPQINLQGAYQFQENEYQRHEGLTSVGVGVSWSAWDAGRTKHEAAEFSSRAERLSQELADLRSEIGLSVRRAWLDVRETRSRIEVARIAVGRAEENLRVVTSRYQAGTETNVVVLSAQTLLAQARRSVSAATYDSALAQLRLRYATGDL